MTIIIVENRNERGENVANSKNEERFLDFIMGNNENFYETFLVNLSEEELKRFLEDNPDFMRDMEKR